MTSQLRTYLIRTEQAYTIEVQGTNTWVDNNNNLYIYVREDDKKRTVAVFRDWVSVVEEEPEKAIDIAPPNIPDPVSLPPYDGDYPLPVPMPPPFPHTGVPDRGIFPFWCGCSQTPCLHVNGTFRIGGGGNNC